MRKQFSGEERSRSIMGVVIFFHVIVCFFLILIVLMQSGRGGGLTEGFAAAENMFGTQTNALLIRATTVLAVLFFVTCLGLAFLSARKNQSLMANKIAPQATMPLDVPSVDGPTSVIINEQK